jgi:hypothetical protein
MERWSYSYDTDNMNTYKSLVRIPAEEANENTEREVGYNRVMDRWSVH